MDFMELKSLPEAKNFYGQYTRPDGKGFKVSCCGKNEGQNGKPNIVFHLPDTTIPLAKESGPCNLLEGLSLVSLAQEICPYFGTETRLILGREIETDKHVSTHKHFYVTLDPTLAKYILVIRQIDVDTQVADLPTPAQAKLTESALHLSIGTPLTGDIHRGRRDYYVLPFNAKYLQPDNTVSGLANGDLDRRRAQAWQLLTQIFGEPTSSLWTPSVGMPADAAKTLDKMGDAVSFLHYDDGLYHEQSFVIDQAGRLLVPKSSINKAVSFVDATVACTEEWEVSQNYLIVTYKQECLSRAAEYIIEQQPTKLTTAMFDRLQILETGLKRAREEYAKQHGVAILLEPHIAHETTWLGQLAKSRARE